MCCEHVCVVVRMSCDAVQVTHGTRLMAVLMKLTVSHSSRRWFTAGSPSLTMANSLMPASWSIRWLITFTFTMTLSWCRSAVSRQMNINYVIQEAQLLLGDRATRKHAKDSWNGRGNDNLGWMTFKCTSRVIKSGTNRKLVHDFLLVVCSNFCRITHRFWEIWCETVQWHWNMPKVIDSCITWKLSCGQGM